MEVWQFPVYNGGHNFSSKTVGGDIRNRSMIIFGVGIILIGVLMILGNIFDFDLSGVFFPGVLVALGVWLLVGLRPGARRGRLRVMPFGDVKRFGQWQAVDEEIVHFVGDVKLDYTHTDLPSGETTLRVMAFVQDVKLIVPPGVGLSVSSIAFVNEAKINGQKQTQIFVPMEYTSPGYAENERQLRVELVGFVVELNLHHE